MRTRKRVELSKWHDFYVYRQYKDAVMKLNSNHMIGVRGSGANRMLDVGSLFYIGGVPSSSSINIGALKNVDLQSDFIGSIEYLQVSNPDLNEYFVSFFSTSCSADNVVRLI